MAFPTTNILDDFNRANSANLDGNWIEISGCGIVSNH
jgi:hypothetical protein